METTTSARSSTWDWSSCLDGMVWFGWVEIQILCIYWEVSMNCKMATVHGFEP